MGHSEGNGSQGMREPYEAFLVAWIGNQGRLEGRVLVKAFPGSPKDEPSLSLKGIPDGYHKE